MAPTLDQLLEMLEDKLVTTSNGSYISVDDLKQLEKDFKEGKTLSEPTGTAKTLHGARKALSEDPEFLKAFEPREPKAPADTTVVNRVAGAEGEVAA